jgi:hypothetical protein
VRGLEGFVRGEWEGRWEEEKYLRGLVLHFAFWNIRGI